MKPPLNNETMEKLKDLQKKYPSATYEPDPDCKCKGIGERIINDWPYPCMCIFVAPDFIPEVVEGLKRWGKP